MTRVFTLLVFLTFLASYSIGQVSFSDNFDTYVDGAYLGTSNTAWTTWSKKPGTTEDAKISSEQFKSSPNSLKIFSTAASGGPTDVVLPFGSKYTTGTFNYAMSMFIPTDKNAYFNYQANATVGQVWALDVNFTESGNLIIKTGATTHLTLVYPKSTWFTLGFNVDLSNNIWSVSIDNVCVGSFKNSSNSLGALNLYPINNKSLFYVDDVSFSYDPTEPTLAFDLGLTNFAVSGGKLAGSKNAASIMAINNGTTDITEIGLVVTTSQGVKETLITLDNPLKQGERYALPLDSLLLQDGINNLSISVGSVNGQLSDNIACNNVYNYQAIAALPAEYKAVLVEEGTGTWCQWCPRGAVFMDRLSHQYKNLFIPIAVHNSTSDPMRVAEYDNFVAFTGYPNCKVNRGAEVDPSGSEDPFLTEIVKPADAKLRTGASYDETTKQLTVSVEATFLKAAPIDQYLTVVLTEDGVTGTSAGYRQSNAYANGTNGEMGGYESLPNPVPAEMMVYDHVARAVFGLTKIADNTLKAPLSVGNVVTKNFTFTVSSDWDINNMHIIPILLKGNSVYVNATTSTINDAVNLGLLSSNEEIILAQDALKLYPNPTTNNATIELQLQNIQDIKVEMYSNLGQLVMNKNLSNQVGNVSIPINTQNLTKGAYVIKTTTEKGSRYDKLIVE